MTRGGKALLFVAGIFVMIQFIQPARNISARAYPTDIRKIYHMPLQVSGILKTSCYDCHSNNTHYPWYANIEPSGWWLDSHIRKGKKELNFDEFGNYSPRRQQSKLKAIASSIKDGTMPIGAYTLIHRNGKLSGTESKLLLNWIENTKDSLSQIK